MSTYRTWLVKRGEEVTGPFPEPLICQQILIGRIKEEDEALSLDGHAWHHYRDIPELVAEITRMLDVDVRDPEWREERIRAVLRHIDERKRPDRRDVESPLQTRTWLSRRTGEDRRQTPETVEQYSYRQTLAEVDKWLSKHRLPNRWGIVFLMGAALATVWVLYRFQVVTPIDLGLRLPQSACSSSPKRAVDWHGCNKSGLLLAGADLRQANLANANLAGANLSYANLSGAKLQGAQFRGAILKGTIWTDGRVCAVESVGVCQ